MSKPKKKFAETTVGKLLFGAASLVNPTLGNLISGVSSPAEAIAAIGKSDASSEDKIKLQQLIHEQQSKEMQAITSRWEADSKSDSWLSKNTRPITLIFLTISLVIFILLDGFNIPFAIDTVWVDLLKSLLITVYVAYFGSRGAEKFKSIGK